MTEVIPENTRWLTVFASESEGKVRLEKGKLLLVNLKAYNLRVALGFHQNKWIAISDYCPHKGASMAQGWLNDENEVVCPLHNYCYNIHSGKETTGQGGPDLTRYYARVNDGKVQIGIPQNTPRV
jgi:nitrite reductase/ring-hydroxylating ferredoxin subunit